MKEDNDTDAHSPNVMMVDAPEEHTIEPNGGEVDEVAIINPDADTMDTDAILASNC